ncbi:MAG TPA: zinc ribbon domain-containing protein [Jatrophihabitans sp.]|jgi:putative FmdB family regulatory protein|uniref:FmdB family zinc ribbon protein n=1 Tax=Jatrophihabitans sp. TaxID=1932789 RepID=UPI002EF093C3
MPIYDLRCQQGHRFEVIQSFTAELPACPVCRSRAVKLPAGCALSGVAAVPPAHDSQPQTWRGTYHGDRGYLAELRAQAQARSRLEAKYPELAADQRPVIAHEGRYEAAPLRLGDPLE